MKKVLLPLILLMAVGSIIAYNQMNEQDQDHADIALASSTERGGIYELGKISKPSKGMAVDFEWTDEAGKNFSFADITKGKVVFLNFWGTWCPPCRREIPDIVSIGNDYKDKDFVIMGMAMEKGKKPEKKLAKFMESNGMTYTNFLSNEEIKLAYGGISAVPTTFIIDKSGKVVEKIVGMRSKEEFLKSIDKVLN